MEEYVIKTAVILAAGMGTRLRQKAIYKPKGFLDIDGRALIERSVDQLLKCGIQKIYIGTGHLSEFYDELANCYSEIQTIRNSKYENTGSMTTFYNMRDQVKDDFLLLESDLLYERDALIQLLTDENESVVLASGQTNSSDEVYIEVNEKKELMSLSKKMNETKVYGELVGICKISRKRYELLCEIFNEDENNKFDYEYILAKSSMIEPLFVKKIEDLVWCEIDDDDHMSRATTSILPKIKAIGDCSD